MQTPELDRLRDVIWRRPLTPQEWAQVQRFLAADPRQRADWEREHRLAEMVRRRVEPAPASNFTAAVMAAVAREIDAPRPARSGWDGLWAGLRQRAAWIGCIACLLLLTASGYHHLQQRNRTTMARSLAQVAAVATVPTWQTLQDYYFISRLTQEASAEDARLLEALSQ
jgi:hypothetical protein